MGLTTKGQEKGWYNIIYMEDLRMDLRAGIQL